MPFRRWLLNVTLALVGYVCLATFPVSARAQACPPIERFTDEIGKAAHFRVLEGAAKERAIALFNHYRSIDVPWQSAYVGIRLDGHAFLIVGMDGTACTGFVVDKTSVREFFEIIDGQGV